MQMDLGVEEKEVSRRMSFFVAGSESGDDICGCGRRHRGDATLVKLKCGCTPIARGHDSQPGARTKTMTRLESEYPQLSEGVKAGWVSATNDKAKTTNPIP